MSDKLLVEGYNELNVELIPGPTWSITVAWDYTGDVGPGTDMETYAYRIDLRSWPDGEWSHPEHPELTGVWLPYTVTSIDIPSGYFPTPGYYEVRIVPGIGWYHTIYFHVDLDGKISAIEHKPATQDPRTIITSITSQ